MRNTSARRGGRPYSRGIRFASFGVTPTEAEKNEAAAKEGCGAGDGYGWCADCWRAIRLTTDGRLFRHRNFRGRDCLGRRPYGGDAA